MKKIPKFKSEEEERNFWLTHDSTDYIDWGEAEKTTFPNLKPSTKTISIKLPETLLFDIEFLASIKGIPYRSLIETFLYEKIREELRIK